jgi:hypothetical protein
VVGLVNSPDLFSCFTLPLSVYAFQELEQVQELISGIGSDTKGKDKRIFPWCGDIYTSAKYYNSIFAIKTHKGSYLQVVWKSKHLPKLKVYA